MSDARTIDQAIADVLAAAKILELPVTVEYSEGWHGRGGGAGVPCVQARLLDADETLLATLPAMDTVGVEDTRDPEAEAMATIINDLPLIATEAAKLEKLLAIVADAASCLEARSDQATRRGWAVSIRERVAALVGGTR